MSEKPLRIAVWAVPILLAGLISAVTVKYKLDDKEDTVEHNHDMYVQQQAIADVKAAAREKAIRDSNSFAEVIRLVREDMCIHNPRKCQ